MTLGTISRRRPPTFMPATPCSQPWMTCAAPSQKTKGRPGLTGVELLALLVRIGAVVQPACVVHADSRLPLEAAAP